MGVYTPILTTIGAAKLANAIASGVPLVITHMAVGDGNGNPVTPNPAQTTLIREVYRSTLNRLVVDPVISSRVNAELVIPAASAGGYTVRELGLFDTDGNLFAVSAYPATYKPNVGEGSVKDVLARLVLEVGNATAITLVVDPNSIMASRAWVTDQVANKLLPLGGLTGQIPMKSSNADGAIAWMDPTDVTINVLAKSEMQTLAAGQTVVNLSTLTTVGVALYIEGSREFDFTINTPTRVTLGRSYPVGTKVYFVQNEPLSQVTASAVAYNGTSNVSDVLDEIDEDLDDKLSKSLTDPQTIAGPLSISNSVALLAQTASRVPYLDADKNLKSSSVTPVELGYLSGVTGAIQPQLQALVKKVVAFSSDGANPGWCNGSISFNIPKTVQYANYQTIFSVMSYGGVNSSFHYTCRVSISVKVQNYAVDYKCTILDGENYDEMVYSRIDGDTNFTYITPNFYVIPFGVTIVTIESGDVPTAFAGVYSATKAAHATKAKVYDNYLEANDGTYTGVRVKTDGTTDRGGYRGFALKTAYSVLNFMASLTSNSSGLLSETFNKWAMLVDGDGKMTTGFVPTAGNNSNEFATTGWAQSEFVHKPAGNLIEVTGDPITPQSITPAHGSVYTFPTNTNRACSLTNSSAEGTTAYFIPKACTDGISNAQQAIVVYTDIFGASTVANLRLRDDTLDINHLSPAMFIRKGPGWLHIGGLYGGLY